jgi:hypothetical protein
MFDTTAAADPAATDSALPSEFGSPAWILVGLTRNVPGWLAYCDGGIAFADVDGEVIFAAPLSDVTEVKFPWYYFGGGLKMKVLGEKYRISFVRPNGALGVPVPADEGRSMAHATLVGEKVRDIATGCRATAKWRTILTRKG